MPYSQVSIDIEAEVSFGTRKTDYGPGTPVFDEIIDGSEEIVSLSIGGVEYTMSELSEMFGPKGKEALRRIIFNQVEEWDNE